MQLAKLSTKYSAICIEFVTRNKDGILQTVQEKSKAISVRVAVTGGDTEGTSTSVHPCAIHTIEAIAATEAIVATMPKSDNTPARSPY